MQRGGRKKAAVNTVEYSGDSGESFSTVQLTPEIDSVHAIHSDVPSKITEAMKIKGGTEVNFQVDTGVTCVKLITIKKRNMQIGSRQQIKSSRCTTPLL